MPGIGKVRWWVVSQTQLPEAGATERLSVAPLSGNEEGKDSRLEKSTA